MSDGCERTLIGARLLSRIISAAALPTRKGGSSNRALIGAAGRLPATFLT
jgi:hypothetical protein